MTYAAPTPSLIVRQPGQFVTVQDCGRVGWKRFGIPRGGAMDVFSLAVANALVGNAGDAPALEFMFVGGEYELSGEACHVAIAGGSFTVFHNGERVSAYRSIRLARGDVLRIGAALDAVWGYLAVAGGVGTPLELGSASTHVPSGIGGLAGQALKAGDAVPLRGEAGDAADGDRPRVLHTAMRAKDTGIRVVLGPQDDHFEPAAIRTFLTEPFTVTHQIDRMGYNFLGQDLPYSRAHNFISDGVVPGSIQVPASGQLIALFADCQPTGGYPKIATVISADRGRLAQTRPGAAVQFSAVTPDEAVALRAAFARRLEQMPRQITTMAGEHGRRSPAFARRT